MANPRRRVPLTRGSNNFAWSIRTTPDVRQQVKVLQLLWDFPSLAETMDYILREAIRGGREADPEKFDSLLNSMGSLRPNLDA